jgi:hypothetical protein
MQTLNLLHPALLLQLQGRLSIRGVYVQKYGFGPGN